MNDDNHWHDLIQRHLAGMASPEETTTLEDALEKDADLRNLYLDYANLDNALEASAEAAKALQEATLESSQQSLQAAEKVSERMQEVTKMAAGIQDLLKIEEALAESLKGIATADAFLATLEDLRQHLASTDAFCNKLSRPRVIKFREQIAE